MLRALWILAITVGVWHSQRPLAAAERIAPITESWDYAAPMKKVAAKFSGKPGAVLHVGCSMTIATPYGQWARQGRGKSENDVAILKWMHAGKDDSTDGFWLSRKEIVEYRAATAVGGLESTHLLLGGNRDNPTIEKILAEHKPQMVVLMVGTYDADARRPVDEYRRNMAEAIDKILAAGAIPIVSTLCPLHSKKGDRTEFTRAYNEALRELAKERGAPLIDLEREVLKLRPDDWNGTIQRKNDIHLTAREAGGDPLTEPTPENLSKSGYLLRTWLSVQKVAEVKRRVLDNK